MTTFALLAPELLKRIKENDLTPPNGLKLIHSYPSVPTVINDDETIVLKPTLVLHNHMQILIIYMEIDDGQGVQALDAYYI